MAQTLLFAVITITLALVCYSIGVWGEFLKKKLMAGHLVFFWLGFVFDTTGTALMTMITRSGESSSSAFHAVTGIVAIALMLLHAVWASIVLAGKKEKLLMTFHKFSIIVWIVWLIPFVSGMIMGMSR